MSPSTRRQQQQRAAELDENTLYGRDLKQKPDRYHAPRCPATFMSWPDGRVRCLLHLGHEGPHR